MAPQANTRIPVAADGTTLVGMSNETVPWVMGRSPRIASGLSDGETETHGAMPAMSCRIDGRTATPLDERAKDGESTCVWPVRGSVRGATSRTRLQVDQRRGSRARSSTVRRYPAAGSTRLALVAVLRPELLQESDRLEEWGDPLHRPVRHVRGCLALSAHGGHVRAFRSEVLGPLIVAGRRGVVD